MDLTSLPKQGICFLIYIASTDGPVSRVSSLTVAQPDKSMPAGPDLLVCMQLFPVRGHHWHFCRTCRGGSIAQLLRLDRRLPTGSAPAINLVVECVLQLAGWNALLRDRVLTSCPAGHPAAAFGTFAADSGALFHSIDLFAALSTGFTDFSADFADPLG
jgi:hypothetical protein